MMWSRYPGELNLLPESGGIELNCFIALPINFHNFKNLNFYFGISMFLIATLTIIFWLYLLKFKSTKAYKLALFGLAFCIISGLAIFETGQNLMLNPRFLSLKISANKKYNFMAGYAMSKILFDILATIIWCLFASYDSNFTSKIAGVLIFCIRQNFSTTTCSIFLFVYCYYRYHLKNENFNFLISTKKLIINYFSIWISSIVSYFFIIHGLSIIDIVGHKKMIKFNPNMSLFKLFQKGLTNPRYFLILLLPSTPIRLILDFFSLLDPRFQHSQIFRTFQDRKYTSTSASIWRIIMFQIISCRGKNLITGWGTNEKIFKNQDLITRKLEGIMAINNNFEHLIKYASLQNTWDVIISNFKIVDNIFEVVWGHEYSKALWQCFKLAPILYGLHQYLNFKNNGLNKKVQEQINKLSKFNILLQYMSKINGNPVEKIEKHLFKNIIYTLLLVNLPSHIAGPTPIKTFSLVTHSVLKFYKLLQNSFLNPKKKFNREDFSYQDSDLSQIISDMFKIFCDMENFSLGRSPQILPNYSEYIFKIDLGDKYHHNIEKIQNILGYVSYFEKYFGFVNLSQNLNFIVHGSIYMSMAFDLVKKFKISDYGLKNLYGLCRIAQIFFVLLDAMSSRFETAALVDKKSHILTNIKKILKIKKEVLKTLTGNRASITAMISILELAQLFKLKINIIRISLLYLGCNILFRHPKNKFDIARFNTIHGFNSIGRALQNKNQLTYGIKLLSYRPIIKLLKIFNLVVYSIQYTILGYVISNGHMSILRGKIYVCYLLKKIKNRITLSPLENPKKISEIMINLMLQILGPRIFHINALEVLKPLDYYMLKILNRAKNKIDTINHMSYIHHNTCLNTWIDDLLSTRMNFIPKDPSKIPIKTKLKYQLIQKTEIGQIYMMKNQIDFFAGVPYHKIWDVAYQNRDLAISQLNKKIRYLKITERIAPEKIDAQHLKLNYELIDKIKLSITSPEQIKMRKNKFTITHKWLLPMVYHISSKWFDSMPKFTRKDQHKYNMCTADLDRSLLLGELLFRGAPWTTIYAIPCQIFEMVSPYTIQKIIFGIILRAGLPGKDDFRQFLPWYRLCKIENFNLPERAKKYNLGLFGSLKAGIENFLMYPIKIFYYFFSKSKADQINFDITSYKIVDRRNKITNFEYEATELLKYHYIYLQVHKLVVAIFKYFKLWSGIRHTQIFDKNANNLEYVMDMVIWPHSRD